MYVLNIVHLYSYCKNWEPLLYYKDYCISEHYSILQCFAPYHCHLGKFLIRVWHLLDIFWWLPFETAHQTAAATNFYWLTIYHLHFQQFPSFDWLVQTEGSRKLSKNSKVKKKTFWSGNSTVLSTVNPKQIVIRR